MLVFVSGPYTKGDVAVNVRNAMKVGNQLLAKGYYPFIPHLTHFWHLVFSKSYTEWLRIDLEVLLRCDAILRIPGDCDGADAEVEYALKHFKRVYYSIEELP